MLGKLPSSIGHALKNVRPGLERLIYADAALDAPEIIRVESVAFDDNEAIPPLFSADGEGESPPLRWRGVPDGAAGIVLVVEDADSPTPAPFIHALAIKTPASDDDLIPGALTRKSAAATEGLLLGRNSLMQASWTPPDPPPGHGPHRYVFEIYAIDHIPELNEPPGKKEILKILRGHTLAKGCMIGIYERNA
ncbi:YbhB/YbcL family Raf kinase inhibitor-like protein [Methylocella tundrae]|uniref:YbhB/YbcL family Raf kinase inhibitor-like protein n=1 Tax=Methylocella tundrae TaxID=227605 RepID=A0A4U8Z4M5_METTU|nr:YbhB/YbcL family Raf kinase inhibitor-like protein [Methylocella tundrae]WPP04189.1 YbhB/YbcL family Raf kinase inhibitor-like protein [Methylocella tundrae]VFU10471.1 YbhB/YbcL family Raf kinase inhibitor-like protein [Methylocella tundrae]